MKTKLKTYSIKAFFVEWHTIKARNKNEASNIFLNGRVKDSLDDKQLEDIQVAEEGDML